MGITNTKQINNKKTLTKQTKQHIDVTHKSNIKTKQNKENKINSKPKQATQSRNNNTNHTHNKKI